MTGNAALQFEDVLNDASLAANENFADLFESKDEASASEGSVVKGVIVGFDKDMIVVDVGIKSEGRIPKKEFLQSGKMPELEVGDTVDVYVERFENRQGEASLSREKALRERVWEDLEEKCESGEQVEGVIFSRVKGGFTVDIQGAIAFLPGSQVDIRPIKDPSALMNVAQPFQILKMDRRRGNIVVSRRAIMEESRSEARDELLNNIHEGQTLEGIVKNITDYGAFIDMGGIDGLLHVTDISWKRINHPSEVLSIGDTINVLVTKFDEKTKRVSLGMKQLETDPWKEVEANYAIGSELTGQITNITDYGAFVQLSDDGIEGLVHVSEMSWTIKNAHPSKIVQPGQEVKVKILDVDTSKHRISLGMKQCVDNPWSTFATKYKQDDIINGEIRNLTDFGLFVRLDGEIDGLIHHSDLNWELTGEEAVNQFNKGDTVQAKILLIDPEKERISLGIKQLTENPKQEALDSFGKGQTITCEVTAVQDDGIEVKLGDDMIAFIKKSDLARERQEQRPNRFAVGDRVDAKITSVDNKNHKVNVSIRALELDQHKHAIEEYGSSDSGASLGDILGAALDEAKKDK